MQSLRFVECSKSLIDCIWDFGQWAEDDTSNSKKPFSPFGKFFDKCGLVHDASMTLKNIKPFDKVEYQIKDESVNDAGTYINTKTQWMRLVRWIGSGSTIPDEYCFPGNIVRWIYLTEKALFPEAAASAPGPQVGAGEFSDAPFTSFVKPYIELGVIKFVSFI